MPDILVEVKGSWLDGKQTAFLDAVHQSVVRALATPADEPLARLIEHRTATTSSRTRHGNGSHGSRSCCSKDVHSRRSANCIKTW